MTPVKIICRPKDGKRDVLEMFVDDEPWRELHVAIFGSRPKLPGECGSGEELKALFRQLEYKQAKLYTLKRLAAKNYCSHELAQLLQKRCVSSHTISQVIQEFQNLGYINDKDWIAGFVQRYWTRGTGPQAIMMKLRAKGVSGPAAEEAVSQVCGAGAQQEKIRRLIATKYRTRDLSDFKQRQKVVASLIRKGFAFQEVIDAMGHSDFDES